MRWLHVKFDMCWIPIAVAMSNGCEAQKPAAAEPNASTPPAHSSKFEGATAGSVFGHVRWVGDKPVVPALEGCSNPVIENGPRDTIIAPNPNRPLIDNATGGVGNAVVFLRNIDPAQAKSLTHGPVRVVQSNHRFKTLQDGREVSFGFVRRGDAIEMDSDDPCFHAIQADGSTFFALTFPDPHQPLSRTLDHKGIVELTSAAGYYWMRAYLFVDDHPYYARTDLAGSFLLDEVPAGEYEVVCWMPNWVEARHERDPESSLVTRLFFRKPIEVRRRIVIQPRAREQIDFEVSRTMFMAPP
jgi:hypothetical protein